MMRRPTSLLIVWVVAFTACKWARPVKYSIPPGLSASFTPLQLTTSVTYARKFCSVLDKEFASERWGACSNYVRMTNAYPAEDLGEIPKNWTLLRLGGFGAQCLAKTAEAFEDAGKHLYDKHGITSYHVELGAFDTSEQNAIRIRDFVAKQPASSRFIVIAHSKGAADVMVALTAYPSELQAIKAVITVAGAVGGSWLVDRLQALNEDILSKLSLPTCTTQRSAGGPNAIDSMRREVRQEFLAQHEHLSVPAFSISAVSTRDTTSEILKPVWDRIAPHAKEQDSHIVEREAIVPGGEFLGRALGDHWAVAMPFDPNDKVKPGARKVIDHNKFPRPALAEAAVRVALEKLSQ